MLISQENGWTTLPLQLLVSAVGRQVPMVITSKEAKGLKSYLFELNKDVQEFEAYARFARDQSLAGTLTWNKEVRHSLIDAPAKRRIPTILVLVMDAHQRPLLSGKKDEWLDWEDEELFRALRAGLMTDGPIGKKSATGTVVERVRSLQLRIKNVDTILNDTPATCTRSPTKRLNQSRQTSNKER
jgi:hypothetical protein